MLVFGRKISAEAEARVWARLDADKEAGDIHRIVAALERAAQYASDYDYASMWLETAKRNMDRFGA